jgi:hypothetical protein
MQVWPDPAQMESCDDYLQAPPMELLTSTLSWWRPLLQTALWLWETQAEQQQQLQQR